MTTSRRKWWLDDAAADDAANVEVRSPNSGRRMAAIRITGGIGTNHTCDVWEFGKVTVAGDATQNDATVKVLNLEADEYLTIGDWYMAWRQPWTLGAGTRWYWTIAPSPCCTFPTGSPAASGSGASGSVASGSGASPSGAGSGAASGSATPGSEIPLVADKWYCVRVRTWDTDCFVGDPISDNTTCDMYPFTVMPPYECQANNAYLTVVSGPYDTYSECVGGCA